MAPPAARNDMRVMEILDDGGWHSAGEFANEGVSLRKALERCLEAGRIECGLPGYCITDAGRAWLAGDS